MGRFSPDFSCSCGCFFFLCFWLPGSVCATYWASLFFRTMGNSWRWNIWLWFLMSFLGFCFSWYFFAHFRRSWGQTVFFCATFCYFCLFLPIFALFALSLPVFGRFLSPFLCPLLPASLPASTRFFARFSPLLASLWNLFWCLWRRLCTPELIILAFYHIDAHRFRSKKNPWNPCKHSSKTHGQDFNGHTRPGF